MRYKLTAKQCRNTLVVSAGFLVAGLLLALLTPAALVISLGGLLGCVLGLLQLGSYTATDESGIITRRFLLRRTIPWTDITSIDTNTVRSLTTVQVTRANGRKVTLGAPRTGAGFADPDFTPALSQLTAHWHQSR
ncbi:PH domain-containing protein [Actinoallomurus sp. CA-150999]|uniref:PH domain-containing protein n=1 Tax=Actinoallomurus sp. CA-150999 TaxID=3239887 RepID=UPI003D919C3F